MIPYDRESNQQDVSKWNVLIAWLMVTLGLFAHLRKNGLAIGYWA